jgi:hypothetical protein
VSYRPKILLALPDSTLGRANAEVAELQSFVERSAADQGVSGDVSIETIKDSIDTQDTGTVLSIVVAGPAAVAIAHGIKSFIAKRGSRVRIYDDAKNVLVEAEGGAAENIDIAATIEAYRKSGRE